MARTSKNEERFRLRYPYAHTRVSGASTRKTYTVFAGDYVCAEAQSKAEAYGRALEYVEDGLINPDPSERGGEIV